MVDANLKPEIEEEEVAPEGLPEVEIEEEVEQEEQQETQDFSQEQEAIEFYSNLAEELDERVLSSLANDLIADYKKDKESRSDWEQAYIKGLDLLGFKFASTI